MQVNLIDVPETATFFYGRQYVRCSEWCQKLIDAYPDDLNSNLSTELQQFHFYIRHKFSATKAEKARFSPAEVIVEDNIEYAFPSVEISLRIFLTLMVTNCKTKRSFSQMKRIKKSKPNNNETGEAGILISAHD